jgi:hypothetical protein
VGVTTVQRKTVRAKRLQLSNVGDNLLTKSIPNKASKPRLSAIKKVVRREIGKDNLETVTVSNFSPIADSITKPSRILPIDAQYNVHLLVFGAM